MGKKAEQDAERADAVAWFRKHAPPGSTVYCILDHVSRSGMLRRIRVLVPCTHDDGPADFFHPNYSAGVLTGYKQAPRDAHKGDGLQVAGCGMDMGFALVSSLSEAVYPDGFGCTGERCPSNDHSNGDRDYTPHRDRCACGPCAVCKGSDVICPVCRMCTRCHTHAVGCPGCPAAPGEAGHAHWHQAGAYALRHRWL
jgi:hypothetical protein